MRAAAYTASLILRLVGGRGLVMEAAAVFTPTPARLADRIPADKPGSLSGLAARGSKPPHRPLAGGGSQTVAAAGLHSSLPLAGGGLGWGSTVGSAA